MVWHVRYHAVVRMVLSVGKSCSGGLVGLGAFSKMGDCDSVECMHGLILFFGVFRCCADPIVSW